MKIQREDRVLKTGGLDNFESKGFMIEQNAKAFEVLSSNLYSNKIKSVIRELGCNAYDAHIDRDKLHKQGDPKVTKWLSPAGTKFTITLPNALEQEFSIRDYGIGLSHDNVMSLYTTYFKSTKEQTNDSIGAFGLGSKSPFSYTGQFTVVSFFNGVKSTYNAHVGENGAPHIVRLMEEDTEEMNGIQISFSVKRDDYKSFSKHLCEVFSFFPEEDQPEVKGDSTFEFKKFGKDTTQNLEGSDWFIFQPYRNSSHYYYSNNVENYQELLDEVKAHIRQGNVVYPIDANAFSHVSLTENQRKLLNERLMIEAPIGTVNVTASRERINYDRFTEQGIVNRLTEIEQEIKKTIEKEFVDCKTLWEFKCLLSEKYRESSRFFKSFYNDLTFKGEKVDDYYVRFDFREEYTFTDINGKSLKGKREFAKVRYYAHYHSPQFNTSNHSFTPNKNVVVIFDDELKTSFVPYFRYHYPNPEVTPVIFVRPISEKHISKTKKALKEQFGDPEFILFSSLEKPPRQVSIAASRYNKDLDVAELKVFVNNFYNAKDCWKYKKKDLSYGGFYVEIAGDRLCGDRIGHQDTLDTLLRKAHDLGWLDREAVNVYGIMRNQTKILENEDYGHKWTNFEDWLKEKVKKETQSLKKYQKAYVLDDVLHNSILSSTCSPLFSLMKISSQLTLRGDLKEYEELHSLVTLKKDEVEVILDNSSENATLKIISDKLGLTSDFKDQIKVPQSLTDKLERFKELKLQISEKYPILVYKDTLGTTWSTNCPFKQKPELIQDYIDAMQLLKGEN